MQGSWVSSPGHDTRQTNSIQNSLLCHQDDTILSSMHCSTMRGNLSKPTLNLSLVMHTLYMTSFIITTLVDAKASSSSSKSPPLVPLPTLPPKHHLNLRLNLYLKTTAASIAANTIPGITSLPTHLNTSKGEFCHPPP